MYDSDEGWCCVGSEDDSDCDWVKVCNDDSIVGDACCIFNEGGFKEDHTRSHDDKCVPKHSTKIVKGKSKAQRDLWAQSSFSHDKHAAAAVTMTRRKAALAAASRKDSRSRRTALRSLDQTPGLRTALREFVAKGTPVPLCYTIPEHLPGFSGKVLKAAREGRPDFAVHRPQVTHLLHRWRRGHFDCEMWAELRVCGVVVDYVSQVNNTDHILSGRAMQDLKLQLLKDGIEPNPGPKHFNNAGWPRGSKPGKKSGRSSRPKEPRTKMPPSKEISKKPQPEVNLCQLQRDIAAKASEALHIEKKEKGKEKEPETFHVDEDAFYLSDADYVFPCNQSDTDQIVDAIGSSTQHFKSPCACVLEFGFAECTGICDGPVAVVHPTHLEVATSSGASTIEAASEPRSKICGWWVPGEGAAIYVFKRVSSIGQSLDAIKMTGSQLCSTSLSDWACSNELTSMELTAGFVREGFLAPCPTGRTPKGFAYCSGSLPSEEYVQRVTVCAERAVIMAVDHDVPLFLNPAGPDHPDAGGERPPVLVGDHHTYANGCALDGWHPDDQVLTECMEAAGWEVLGIHVTYQRMTGPDPNRDDRLVSDRAIPIVEEPIWFGYVDVLVPAPIPSWRESLFGCVAGYFHTAKARLGRDTRQTLLRSFVFCPHQVSVALTTFPTNCTQEQVDNSSRQKLLRLPSLPIPQTLAAQVLCGSEMVVNLVATHQLNALGAGRAPSRPLLDAPVTAQTEPRLRDDQVAELLRGIVHQRHDYLPQVQQLRSQLPQTRKSWWDSMDTVVTVGASTSVACLIFACQDILPLAWTAMIQTLSCVVCVSAFVATCLQSQRRSWSSTKGLS